MNKISSIKAMLKALKIPQPQQNEMCCLVLLALAELTPQTDWNNATNNWHRIHDLLHFINRSLGGSYAENTRETIRKHAVHYFRSAAIIEDNGKATNSPNYRYRLTDEVLQIIRRLNTDTWHKRCSHFLKNHRSLIEKLEQKRTLSKIPVYINGKQLEFSQGKHNELQKAIIEEFAPRFAPGSRCLYVGDTTNRSLLLDEEYLDGLGIQLSVNNKLPDIVLYSTEKKWLYFIEAVTSSGPISPARKNELDTMTLDTSVGIIYVTAFSDFRSFNKFSGQIAWDTEVWIAAAPDHMIHLNGDRFIGPRGE